MQSVVVALIALFALPLAYNASSSTTADISTHCSDQFYDINMEILVSGEITSKPRIILKVGGSGSIELSSDEDNYLIAVQTGPLIESGEVLVPTSFDFTYETEGEAGKINTTMNLPLGQTVLLGAKTNMDGDVQLNASINVIAEAPKW